MTRQFKLPDLGEGVKEGQVLRLLVAEGEHVAEDQLLMEVETDKSAVEIPSPYAGVIARWHVSENQVVNVGALMVTFDDTDAAPLPSGNARAARAAGTPGAPAVAARAPTSAPAPTAAGSARTPASPAVRKLARALGVDLDAITGSGPGGRVLRADVERASAAPGAAPPPAAQTVDALAPAETPAVPPVAPFEPTGPTEATEATEPEGRDERDDVGPVRRAPLSRTRLAIARAMSHSVSIIPHVTDCDDADVTDLDRLRRGYNDAAPAGAKLGLLPFVIRAVCRALQTHPMLNASFDAEREEIVYKRYYHIAVGVQTERGLVAPVLRNVDRMGVAAIARELAPLAEKARRGTLSLDETRGATYTISNAGAMGGSRYSTPIVTHPQVAVLAVGRSRRMPWVVNDAVVPRLVMPLSHSMDHRLIDGALEIAFMKQLIGDLENPGRIVL